MDRFYVCFEAAGLGICSLTLLAFVVPLLQMDGADVVLNIVRLRRRVWALRTLVPLHLVVDCIDVHSQIPGLRRFMRTIGALGLSLSVVDFPDVPVKVVLVGRLISAKVTREDRPLLRIVDVGNVI